MKDKAIRILDENRVLAISTLRSDGWPQNTMVGYANEDIFVYFIISRLGQKFANIMRDDRVSLAIGRDFQDPSDILALSIAAHASEVRDDKQREGIFDRLIDRHPSLRRLEPPSINSAAVMRAHPTVISILDYSKGFGHTDVLIVAPGGLTEMTEARADDWGFSTDLKRM